MSVKIVWSERAQDRKAQVADAHWLLKFAETDLDRVSAVVHEELSLQARSFILKGGVIGFDVENHDAAQMQNDLDMVHGRRQFTLEHLRGFQAELRSGLARLAKGVRWTCASGELTVHLYPAPDGRLFFASVGRGEWTTAFTVCALRAFLAVSGRLRRCRYEKCGRWFIAAKRQEFCSPQHGGIVRTRAKRLKDAEQRVQLSEKRHERYVQQVRKVNQKARVGRYTRRRPA